MFETVEIFTQPAHSSVDAQHVPGDLHLAVMLGELFIDVQ